MICCRSRWKEEPSHFHLKPHLARLFIVSLMCVVLLLTVRMFTGLKTSITVTIWERVVITLVGLMSCEGKNWVKNKPNSHRGLAFQQLNSLKTSHLQFCMTQKSGEGNSLCVFSCLMVPPFPVFVKDSCTQKCHYGWTNQANFTHLKPVLDTHGFIMNVPDLVTSTEVPFNFTALLCNCFHVMLFFGRYEKNTFID